MTQVPSDQFEPRTAWSGMLLGPSLLRLSAAARLGGALVVIGALWAATLWALR